MDPKRREKTDRLLDAVGGIDDEFVNEAMNWQQKRARPARKSSFIRVLLIAASLVLVMSVGISAMFIALRQSDGSKTPNGYKPGNISDGAPEGNSAPTLDSLLADCTQSASFTACSAENLPYFDGTVRIAVENCSTGELFVSRPLSTGEQNSIRREFQAVGTQLEYSPVASYRVWVTLGDGTVLTPCLSVSGGNIGTGILFDYESERDPTSIFTDLLSALKT